MRRSMSELIFVRMCPQPAWSARHSTDLNSLHIAAVSLCRKMYYSVKLLFLYYYCSVWKIIEPRGGWKSRAWHIFLAKHRLFRAYIYTGVSICTSCHYCRIGPTVKICTCYWRVAVIQDRQEIRPPNKPNKLVFIIMKMKSQSVTTIVVHYFVEIQYKDINLKNSFSCEKMYSKCCWYKIEEADQIDDIIWLL